MAILGPGPIGLTSLLNSKAIGAGKVLMVGQRSRLAIAEELGAVCIDFEKSDAVAEVLRLTDGRRADEVIEAAGTPHHLSSLLTLSNPAEN